MKRLLLRLLRCTPDAQNAASRAACGKLAGWVGIGCNVLLFLCKAIAGMLSGSVSVTADAINNLSDASGSLITLLGFRIAELPADARHPYGHARMEYLSGLAVAATVLVLGAEMAKTSVVKIFHPSPVAFSWLTVGILGGSILVKLWLSSFTRELGDAIDSPTLRAAAADSRNDVISTVAALGAGLLSSLGLAIDGHVGLVVALFILWSGVSMARDTIDPLLGTAPDPALVEQVSDIIRAHDKVRGLHDLMIHDYGPGRRFASAHVEMDYREDPLVCHGIIDHMEREIQQTCGLQLVIHYDPIVTDDRELNHLRRLVRNEVRYLDERLTIHDFRLVRSPDRNTLFFDLSIPYDMAERKQEIRDAIDRRLSFEDADYETIITFDEIPNSPAAHSPADNQA